MSDLFDPLLAAGPVRAELGDQAWLQAMLDVEAALAGALADAGLLQPAHARNIAEACRAEYYDVVELGAQAVAIGNPAGPLVRALTTQVHGDAAGYVHFGATSQDVLDSALMLVVARALVPLLEDLEACADRAAELAERYARTVQAGRTLLQQALPTTFGCVVASWLSGLDTVIGRLGAYRPAAQLGGAAGTLASYGEHGPAVVKAFSERLQLDEPQLPWHTERTRVAELTGLLGEVDGVAARIARTVTLLAQTEIGEVFEAGPAGSGGSSTLPHKRNPVAAVAVLACARPAPGLVASVFAAMEQDHQRAAGAWHAEWRPLQELLRGTGSAVHWLRTSLERLRVDERAMRENVRDELMTERVTGALVDKAGRLAAHDAVADCSRRAAAGEGALVDLLAAHPLVGKHLDRAGIVGLLDPSGYLGSAQTFVERALSAHHKRKGHA
ncbi:adenylosuccinate lyase family protein [Amycolatopsis sp. NPDC059657]|uniref:class-II fumarase/aspartase family protein n=1 Tax=Amycolatopsis sp. NPDC059657 TaxID=3346899 RepID=UPI00366AA56A